MPASLPEVSSLDCPKCQQPYEWRPEYVGKTGRCVCGQVIKVPPLPKAWPAVLKDVNAPSGLQAAEQALAIYAPPTPQNAISMNPFRGLEREDELPEEVERELAELGHYAESHPMEYDKFRDQQVPLGLLAAGIAIMLGQVAYMTQGQGVALFAATVLIALQLLVNLVLIIGGVVLAAWLTGINFGPLNLAILKLSAICVAPTVLGSMLTQAMGGNVAVAMLGIGVSIICYWALFSYLFRLDGAQTMTCVMVIGVIRFAVHMFILARLGALVTGGIGVEAGMG